MKLKFLLIFLLNTVAFTLSAQDDCCNADLLQNGNTLSIASSDGNGTFENLSACSCLAQDEHDSYWFTFEAVTSGTFEMMIVPAALSADFDFALYGEECPCGPSTTVTSCDFTGPINNGPFFETGISSTPMATFGVPGATEWQPTVNVVAGTTYYIVADNITNNGAGFDIQFAGTATIGPPSTVGNPVLGNISGTTTTCPNATETYSIVPIMGISNYNWTVSPPLATPTPDGASTVTIDWAVEGSYQVCVTGQEGCVTSNETCITVDVTAIPDGSIMAEACFGDFYVAPNGQSYEAPGFYQLTFTSYQGCDSIINLDLEANFASFGLVDLEVCPSGCVTYNGIDYCEGGTVEVVYPNANFEGCDSIDIITILEVPFFADFVPNPPGTIDCQNSVVTLDGNASLAGNNPTFEWTDENGVVVSNSPFLDATEGGDYTLTVFSTTATGDQCDVSTTVTILEQTDGPDISAFGGDIDCTNPTIDLMGDSNTPNVTFGWSGPNGFQSNDQNPNVNEAGIYTLIVTDANGCTSEADAEVFADLDMPDISALGDDIDCQNTIANLTGGSMTPNVTFEWSGPNNYQSNDQNPTVTDPGLYVLIVTAPNGCTAEATADVFSDMTIPDISALGAMIDCNNLMPTLTGGSTTPNVTFEWTGPNNFNSFEESPEVVSFGDYNLLVTAPNGCTATLDVLVSEDISPPDVSASGGTVDCITTDLQLAGGSNTNNVNYSWTGPNNFTSNDATPTASDPGIYTLLVTAPNGCTAEAEAEIIQDADVPQVSATGGTIDCNVPILLLESFPSDPNVTFEWTGPNNFTSNEQNPMVTGQGNYSVVITAANGCTADALAVVSEDLAVPDANASGGLLTCTATSVEIIGASNTAGVIYTWTGPGGFMSNDPTPDVTDAGNYILVVTAGNGCTAEASAMVDLDADLPDAMALGDTINCNITQVQISGSSTTPGVTFEWTGPNGFMSNDLNPTVTDPGQYILTVTAPSNCSTTATAFVAEDTASPMVDAPPTFLTCDDPQAILQTTTTDNISQYSWTGPNGFMSDEASPTVMDAGVYELTILGANGCDNVLEFTVDADQDLPDISTQGGTITCNEMIVEISGSSTATGVTYSWVGPNGFTSAEANPMVSEMGDYTLTVTATNGCTVAETALVEEDVEQPDIQAIGGIIGCGSPMTNLEGNSTTPDVIYSWVGPNGFMSDEANPQVSEGGNYTLTITATNGCTNSMMAMVMADFAEPQVSAAGGELTCNENEINIVGNSSTANVTYSWTGPNGFMSDEQMPLISEEGGYTLVVTGPNNCTNSETVMVTADVDLPDVSAVGGILDCADPTVDLAGNSTTANVTFTWEGPGGIMLNEQNPQVTVAGDYVLIVTAANGCSATAMVTVDQDADVPDVSALGGTIDCNNTDILIEANSVSPDVTFAWTGPNGFSTTDQNPTIDEPGNYSVIVTASNGCTAEAIAVVDTDLEEPDASATGGEITCSNPSATLSANSTTAGVTYFWVGQGGFTSDEQMVAVTEAGNYGLVVTAPNGCTTSINNVVVTQDADVPVASVEDETLNCLITEIELTSTVNQTNVIYEWTGPNGFSSNDPNPLVTEAGTYTLVVTSDNDCSASASALVISDTDVPLIEIGTLTEFDCVTTEVTIDAGNSSMGNDFTISWTTLNGNILSGSNSLMPIVDESGVYTLEIINNQNGCSNTEDITINESGEAPSDAEISFSNPTCFGDNDGQIIIESVAGGTPPYLYSFNGGNFGSTASFNGLSGGDFELIIQDATGCEWETIVPLAEPTELMVNLVATNGTTLVQLGQNIGLDAQVTIPESDLASVVWNTTEGFVENCDSCLNPQVIPINTTTYEITVIDQSGCIASDNIEIIVDRQRPFFVPNVFSPNNDGVNDVLFSFAGESVSNVKSFQIFDRWGEPLFNVFNIQPNDIQMGWDGKFRGEILEAGVYVYFAEVEFIDGETELFKGDVTLLR